MPEGVPGEVYGFWQAHQIGGKLAWKLLFEPTIKICREGFRVSKVLAFSIKRAELDIRNNEAMARVFIDPITDQIYKENEIIRMPELANTLSLISRENVNAFYNGSLTKIMVDEINTNGDLAITSI